MMCLYRQLFNTSYFIIKIVSVQCDLKTINCHLNLTIDAHLSQRSDGFNTVSSAVV